MKISVIIPVYKTEEHIRQCVDSVLSQTYKNLEVILVDDGSPDNCPAICDGYAAADPRVRVIHKKNEGLFAAVGDGIKEATGDYIGFVDSDDWVEQDMFERLFEAAQKDDADIAVCAYVLHLQEGFEKNRLRLDEGLYEGERLEKEIKQKFIFQKIIYASRINKLFKAELLNQNLDFQNYTITLGEDLARVLAAMLDAKKVSVLPDSFLYHYRYNPQSITRSNYIKDFPSKCAECFEEICHILQKKGRIDLMGDLKLLHAGHVIWCLNNEMKSGLSKQEIKAKLTEIMSDSLTQECIKLYRKQKGLSLKTRITCFLIAKKQVVLYYYIKRRLTK